MTDIVERLRVFIRFEDRDDYQNHVVWKAADEIERLRNVVALLIEYEEHDENILKGAVMWEALIEAAHRALEGKNS